MKAPALPTEALMTVTGLPYPLKAKGKVREVFDLGEHYLIVATDRLSAFDVVMPNGVPGKGILLTQISLWWFEQAATVFPTHLVPDHLAALTRALKGHEHLIPRSMLVRKLVPLPVEAVVRGYLAGSGFKEYVRTGAILDHSLPKGLLDGSALPEPIFTPSTKAAEGHDEAITRARCAEILGEKVFRQVHDTSIALYRMGNARAAKAGVILADTKFEFGTAPDGSLVLIDEVLTPLLAARELAAGAFAAFLRQAVRPRLAGSPAVEQDRAGPPPTGRRDREDAGALPRVPRTPDGLNDPVRS
jgi:phosphoribosylaminoimidazole-succinocarboxamide synthase